MKCREDSWRRVAPSTWVSRSVERPNRFRPFVEPLEDRQLLAAVAWTLDSGQSFITLSIPDQTINYNGTDINAQFRNQTGSTSNPWTTNTTHITGQLATEFVDGSTIQFLTGQSSLTSLTSGNYRPNFASFDALQLPPTYTDTTTAPGEIGARLLGFGFVAAFLSINDLAYDAASATLPIAAGNFAANTTTFGAVTGTLGLDGVPIFLIGQLVPDSLDSLTSPLAGTNAAPTGSITSLGGLQRQLTLPLDIPVSFIPPGATTPLSATITGQIVATGTAVQQSYSPPGRHLFYNQSFFDGNDASINAADDAAIDTSKSAYLHTGANATWSNISGYDKGINGIMVDLGGLGNHAAISADDFVFKVGNNNNPQSWAAAPAPSAISVRLGAGMSGVDRVVITWADGAIAKTWLEVQVLSTADTGLPAADTFFWGNAVGGSGDGDSANAAPTNVTDELGARNNPKGFGNFATVTFSYDYNKDRNVNTTDQLISRNNATGFGTQLVKINIGTAGPLAPEGGGGSVNFVEDGDAGIASALAVSSGDSDDSAELPANVAARLEEASSGKRVTAVYYHQLAITAASDAYDDKDGDELPACDDELIESLSANLACLIDLGRTA